ncbi:MAG: hypothetical protein AAF639_13580 [Chloroflexota bacterium]
MKTLSQIVNEKPFDDFSDWWPMGSSFMAFMSKAIVSEWTALPTGDAAHTLATVQTYVNEYIQTVFKRDANASLTSQFVNEPSTSSFLSGEFDALSYAFYRSAFEQMADNIDAYTDSLERERRLFTKRVGKTFFGQVHEHVQLNLPDQLDTQADFAQLKSAIGTTGAFLADQGYLRDHFGFHFDVEIEHMGNNISQSDDDFLGNLHNNGIAHAFYEMGYPVILPSAVYLYHTIGEAQHHSSRTIEDLFELVGYEARETDDFDPIGYPSDMVVELWEIRKLA